MKRACASAVRRMASAALLSSCLAGAQHLASTGFSIGLPHAVSGLRLSYDKLGTQPCLGADLVFGAQGHNPENFTVHLTAGSLALRWDIPIAGRSIIYGPVLAAGTDFGSAVPPLERTFGLAGVQIRVYFLRGMHIEYLAAGTFNQDYRHPGAIDYQLSLSLGYTWFGLQPYADDWRTRTGRNALLFVLPVGVYTAAFAMGVGLLFLLMLGFD